jgi:hypothetical protein
MTTVVLVACSAAGADPGAPASRAPSAPAGWRPLPPIAAAVAAAAVADGVVIDAADAWGEPAIGCYAVRLALHGSTASAAALADQVLDGLRPAATLRPPASPGAAPSAPGTAPSAPGTAPSAPGTAPSAPGTATGSANRAAGAARAEELTFSELVTPSSTSDVLTFAFARPPYRGRVRAQLGAGRLTALACFGNQREPATCEPACTRLLEAGP